MSHPMPGPPATGAWPRSRGPTAVRCTRRACDGTRRGAQGGRGFGYDPIFVPEGEHRTMAELEDEEKDRISHRGRAFRALAELLSA